MTLDPAKACRAILPLVLLLLPGLAGSLRAAPERKVVLIAGPITGHPKEAHEYEKSVILLKNLLDQARDATGVRAETYFHGWPDDPAALQSADAIVLLTDGGDRREADHPLYVGSRRDTLLALARRGVGVAQIHWTTFHPSRFHEETTEVFGGYFDYETGPGQPPWHSVIQHGTWDVRLPHPEHAIARGVKPFRLKEEFYFRLRFREDASRLVPILALDDEATLEKTVAWALERADGGRAFGTTAGHYFENWWDESYRRLLLNAIVWTARGEVPPAGVDVALAPRRKALIVTGYQHPAHDWRTTTAALFQVIEAEPRLRVDVTEDPEDLGRGAIEDVDLLVLNYNNWDRPGLSAASREALERHLARGRGLMVVHFANGAFNRTLPRADSDWEAYRTRIVRRVWMHGEGGSSHDPYGPFEVAITAPAHPLTQGLTSFPTEDELYFRQEGPLPIEVLATARSKVTGHDEPMAWVYEEAGGKVFQTVLGHAEASIRKAGALMRRGAAWAAGLSPLGFDPPISLTEGGLWREGSPWSPAASEARAVKGAEAPASPPATRPDPQPGAAPASRPAEKKGDARAPAQGDRESAAARQQGEPPAASHTDLLPANPGLDGGEGGHWGRQGEKDWEDDRWARADIGPFLTSALSVPAGTIRKAISIRVGTRGEGTVAFDEDALGLRAAWTGGFVDPSPARFGLIQMPKVRGAIVLDAPAGPLWKADPGGAGDGGAPVRPERLRYRGLRLAGRRVLLSYEVEGRAALEAPWLEGSAELPIFTRTLEVGPGDATVTLALAAVEGAVPYSPQGAGARLLGLRRGDQMLLARLLESEGTSPGAQSTRLTSREGAFHLVIPPSKGPLRVKALVARGPAEKLPELLRGLAQSAPPEDLHALEERRETLWGAPLELSGALGKDEGPYAIDTLPVPLENPYHALLFLSGHDFFSNGAAAVCTAHGDVWIVQGIDRSLRQVRWRRFATGLYQPLGLKVIDDVVHVLGRDQITRLQDQDGDGEADRYERFADCPTASIGGHDFHTCLETDSAGRLYYLSPRGLHRVARDGSAEEIIAAGWRNPNGLAVGPQDLITVSPQEGEWTPASSIAEAREGGWHGYPGPRPAPERPLGYDPPLCWIPRHIDNSSGSQVWAPVGAWGPLAGQLLHLSFGRCSMILVLRDEVEGQAQAALFPLKGRFLSGVMRGRVHPRDGQLYVTGLRGWTTNAVADGCFQRVRYTGQRECLPVSWRAHRDGLRITFSERLDPETAADASSYLVEAWGYLYSAAYGSPELSTRLPGQVGHDRLRVEAVAVLDDGRSVFLRVRDLGPVMQLRVKGSFRTAAGKEAACELFATVHRMAAPLDLGEEAFGSMDTEADPALLERLEPGLALELISSPAVSASAPGPVTIPASTDARLTRLAALRVPDGTAPSAFLPPGPFRAVASGLLLVEGRSMARLSAQGRGTLRVIVDGEAVLEAAGGDLGAARGRDVVLRGGARPLRIEYESPPQGDAWFRVFWESAGFAREAIPPTALFHEAAKAVAPAGSSTASAAAIVRGRALRSGRDLAASWRCRACHRSMAAAASTGRAELPGRAPELRGLGARRQRPWLLAKLLHPTETGHEPRMPDVLSALLPELRPGAAGDLVAFLESLPADGFTAPGAGGDADAQEDPERLAHGQQLFESIGCLGCHVPPGGSTRAQERPAANGLEPLRLEGLAAKWSAAALRAFLLDPCRLYPAIAMPTFPLQEEEAMDLSAYLLASAQEVASGTDAPSSLASSGERSSSVAVEDPGREDSARRGALLAATLGCARCHELPVEDRFHAPSWEDIVARSWATGGCAAERPAPVTPRLRLSAAEREALEAFRAGAGGEGSASVPAEEAAQLIEQLRCGACHERDGAQALWSSGPQELTSLEDSASSEKTLQQVPALTFVGEALQTPWIERLLSSASSRRLRPWLDARMPAFPTHARAIAAGLTLEHGIEPSGEREEPIDPRLAEIGARLLEVQGGLGCVTCHGVGEAPARMRLHFGVTNLAHARERLRKEHYLRWLLAPQRVAPATPMPAFATDDGRSALEGVFGGDARLQFEAIWHRLGEVAVR